jgi:hypothetical protein
MFEFVITIIINFAMKHFASSIEMLIFKIIFSMYDIINV